MKCNRSYYYLLENGMMMICFIHLIIELHVTMMICFVSIMYAAEMVGIKRF